LEIKQLKLYKEEDNEKTSPKRRVEITFELRDVNEKLLYNNALKDVLKYINS
jgi:hypothetical protein